MILAGDFVNKGPYSLTVIQWLMSNANAYAVVSTIVQGLAKNIL